MSKFLACFISAALAITIYAIIDAVWYFREHREKRPKFLRITRENTTAHAVYECVNCGCEFSVITHESVKDGRLYWRNYSFCPWCGQKLFYPLEPERFDSITKDKKEENK